MKKREALSLAMHLGWTMVFSLVVPLLAGIWLDRKLGTMPLFTLVGAVLGILAATVGVARSTLRIFRAAVEESDEQTDGNFEEEPE